MKNNLSDIIRDQMRKDGKRFHACDNVSEYLDDEKRSLLVDELSIKFRGVLNSLLIDVETDPNSMDTAKRLAKMYVYEIMEGRYFSQPDVTAFPNDDGDAYKGMLVIRAEIRSMCSHHHQPVNGTVYIGIIPNEKVIGLSKYIRLAQWHARRGTLQEELCNRIAKAISEATGSPDVAVYIQATHGCCENRGVMAHSSLTQTTVLRGEFNSADVKKEFFDNIQLQQTYRKD